jgi:hypothetical protein
MALSDEDKAKIDAMGHHEMSLVMRFSSLLLFPWNNEDAAKYFMDRWNSFEGQNEGDSDRRSVS